MVGSIHKYGAVCDLRLMALTGFELNFAFQIDIPCCEQSLVEIGINSPYGKLQFRMVSDDLIGRLPLFNKRRDDSVFLVKLKLLPGKIDSGPGIRKLITVFPIRKPCVIGVFMGDCAMIDLLWASVANIGSFVQPVAPFLFKVFAGLVASWTGSTLNTAKDNLAAGIGLFAVIAMDTEVLSIIKGTLMVPVGQAMALYLFRDSGRILTKEFGAILKGCTFVQFIFNVNTIFKCKMFLVTWDIFTHKFSFYCCQRER